MNIGSNFDIGLSEIQNTERITKSGRPVERAVNNEDKKGTKKKKKINDPQTYF